MTNIHTIIVFVCNKKLFKNKNIMGSLHHFADLVALNNNYLKSIDYFFKTDNR